MFGTILISVCTLMHLYVFWRISTIAAVFHRRPFRVVVFLSGLFLWTIFFFGRTVGHGGEGFFASAVESAGMSWMAVLFLLFVSFLTLDVITGFGIFCRRLAPRLRQWALVLGCVLSIIAIVQGFRSPVLKNHEIRMAGLPPALDGTVVVAISDTHLGSQLGARWMGDVVSRVQKENPALIVLLGDIYEGHGGDQKELAPVMQKLKAPLGVWAVLGNHDFHGGGEESRLFMEAAGINVLRNEYVEIENGFILAGVDDLNERRQAARNNEFVLQAVQGRPSGATILLSHTPSQLEQAAGSGVDLMLCGHTHGGQIWPFGYLVRLVHPFLEGLHEVGGMKVLISRGTGTWGPRMRLWKPGEILRITLRSEPRLDLFSDSMN